MKKFFQKNLLIILAVISMGFLSSYIYADSAAGVLRVTRGGTGVENITEGQFLIGKSIDEMQATSSISMDSAGNVTITKGLTVATAVISGVSAGPMTVTGKLEIDQNSDINSLYIDAESTIQQVFKIVADTQTSGSAFYIDCDSPNFSSAYGLFGAIVENSSATGKAFYLKQDGTGDNMLVDTNGNASSFVIDSEAMSSVVISVTAENSSGNIVNIDDKFILDYEGNVGVGTISPTNLLDIYDATATSTMYIYSGGAGLGGEIIMEDNDGAGCTEITTLDGTITGATVTCP